MNTTRIYAIFIRQIFILRDNPIRLIPYFLWAILDIILWGFITKYLNAVGNPAISFIPTLLGAVLLWDFLVRVHIGVTMPFLEDVWSKNFLNIFASPLLVSEYMIGFVLTSIVTSFAGLVVMLILAGGLFGLSLLQLGLLLFPFILILFLFGVALGILGAGLILRFGPSAEWLVWPIPAVLGPFVGIFYPVSVLPPWMQLVSYVLPPTYVFEGMRSAILSGTFSSTALLAGVALAFIYIALAYAFFVFIYRRVVRDGLIARFDAEGA